MTTRVLQVIGFSTGGIARHVAAIVSGLDGRHGLVVDVAGPQDLPVTLPKPLYPIAIPRALRGHSRVRRALARMLRQESYDVVHAHGLRAGIDAGLAGRETGATLVASVHNLVLGETGGSVRAALSRPAERLVVRLNHRVLAPSEDIARRLRAAARHAAGRVEVLHLGVEEPRTARRPREEIRAELELDRDQRAIVTVARLAPQKALHVLLDATARLRPSVVTVIVGGGALEDELRRTAARLRIESRVRWLGLRSDVWDVLGAADVFCLSSVWEACSLAAQEAMWLGVPVVATAVGGMPELIRDRAWGRLVPPGDPAALAAALDEVLFSPEATAGWAAAGRAHLERSFSTVHMLGRLQDIYLAGSGSGS